MASMRLLLLVFSATTLAAPLATVLPQTGAAAVWKALQRVVATYPEENVEQQLKTLMRIVAEEAYSQHKEIHPGKPDIVLP